MNSNSDPRVPDSDAFENAKREFDEYVKARRKAAGIKSDSGGVWALALSGGGIRSATFCLGLVRGLARRELLKNFDYLSTVSGGGYLGASLGRLYGETARGKKVEDGVADKDSMWLWWLRNNGRYLTPAGVKDLGFAAASIMRGVISTHLEIGVLALTAAALILFPHVLVALFPPVYEGTLWSHAVLARLPSTWVWLMVIPLFVCVYQLFAYWYTRDNYSRIGTALIVLAATACGATCWMAAHEALTSISGVKLAIALLAAAPALALVGVALDRLRGISVTAQRLARTKRLSYGLWTLAVFAAISILDWCTWRLTRLFWGNSFHQVALKVGGVVLILTAIARLALPEFQRRMAAIKRPSLNIERTLNALGVTLIISVAVLWTSILSIALFQREDLLTLWITRWDNLHYIPPVMTLLAVVVVCMFYLLATRNSFDLLNLASLHNFYRARIERAYVSSGNSGNVRSRFPVSALDKVSSSATAKVTPLTEAIDGDDIDLDMYRPHMWGGPVHLINCCINQSVDDRTGLYNADRKGVALTVSSLGIEIGTKFPSEAPRGLVGKLSKWIAISGAAASTGMGSRTSPGFAALLFMSGIRLGFWTPSLGAKASKPIVRLKDKFVRWAPKPIAIVAESLARFPGLSNPLWYVSDGGHFDNTGIYALLKRRPRVIVAADCGADPKYLFADLESLVRKAKIDYGVTIEFIPNDPVAMPAPLNQIVGTPETIQPGLGSQWLVLGRMAYSNGEIGTLLVVKPRRLDAMPFDLVAYADRNAEFPQQTTGDQFFDESQWESYHQLGLLLGCRFSHQLIRDAIKATHQTTRALSSLEEAERQESIMRAKENRSNRVGFSARTTLKAGISLSLAFAIWQGFEQYREGKRSEQRSYEKEIQELNTKLPTQEIDALLKRQLNSIRVESVTRGDDAIQMLLEKLNRRCSVMENEIKIEECADVHRDVYEKVPFLPVPFYDYWFLDKMDAYRDLLARRAGSAFAFNIAIPVNGNAGYLPGYSESPLATNIGANRCDEPSSTHSESRSPCASEVINAVSGIATPPYTMSSENEKKCASDVRVFVHVYDEESRPSAQQDGRELMGAVGANRAPVENVVATAVRLGRTTPYVWSRPTIVYPANTSPACLRAVEDRFEGRVLLREYRSGKPNQLELWIPPRTLTSVSTVQGVPPDDDSEVKIEGEETVEPKVPRVVPQIDHLPWVHYAAGRLLSDPRSSDIVFNSDAIKPSLRQVEAVRAYWRQLTRICDRTRPVGRLSIHGFASDDPVIASRSLSHLTSDGIDKYQDKLNVELANLRAAGLAAVLANEMKAISPNARVSVDLNRWKSMSDMRELRDRDTSLANVGPAHSRTRDYRSATVSIDDFSCISD